MRVLFVLYAVTQCISVSFRQKNNGCTLLGCDVPENTKNEIAHILEGIIARLNGGNRQQHHLGLTATTNWKAPLALLRHKLEADLSSWSLVVNELRKECPFGYGCAAASEQKMDPATKTHIAKILEGILGNLQGK
eukprot:GEMP01133597.1.p1 GENE.GEMP01133597.1~~GEMP01133597.1.p1  ORF type:complete len:135 (+),score=31.57 GEMP01133597.1:57-461(+)